MAEIKIRNYPYYLLVTGLFLALISPNALSKGMFLDGLLYAAVSANLASGIGTFWLPSLSQTFAQEFTGHPPLALGLQSLFFELLGYGHITEKIYSLLMFALTGLLIVRLWRHFSGKDGWIPLFFFLLFPVAGWAATNNILENTLMVFTTLSVYLFVKGDESTRIVKTLYWSIAGASLAAGFLTKGFVTFFPLSFPFLYYVFLKKNSWKSFVLPTLILALIPVVIVGILYVSMPEVQYLLQRYLEEQVAGSLAHGKTVSWRGFILARALSESVCGGLAVILFLWWGRKNSERNRNGLNRRKAMFFLLFALTGILPVMISLKQSGFYILPVYPFVAMAMALFAVDFVRSLVGRAEGNRKIRQVLTWIPASIFFLSVLSCIFFANHYGRDKVRLQDIERIAARMEPGDILSMHPAMWDDYSLYGYFARFRHLSLDVRKEAMHTYYIQYSHLDREGVPQGYVPLEADTRKILIFRREARP